MKTNRDSLTRIIVGLAILVVIAGAAIALTLLRGQAAPIEEEQPFGGNAISQAQVPTPEPTETPAPTPTPTAVPTATTEPDLRFGIFPLRHSCDVYTKILARVLEEELRLNIELVSYSGPAPLYADLAEAKIDYTLCYAGLDDSQYLEEYVGYIKVYDNRFVDENDIWMQPVVTARKLNDIRKDQPCLHHMMEAFKFSVADRYLSVTRWFEENGDLASDWSNCQ